jgi:VWFA-related protein
MTERAAPSVRLQVARVALSAALAGVLFGAPAVGGGSSSRQKKSAAPPVETAPVGAPDEGTLLSLKTQLVVVPFTVADRNNRYVNDLKPQDIRLLENGVEQEVTSLGRTSEAPLALALALDFSGSMITRLPIVKRAAAQFLERMLRLKEDRAAILAFQQDVTPVSPLTGDVAELKRALADVDARLPSPVGRVMPFDVGRPTTPGTALNAAVYLAADDLLTRTAIPPGARRVIVVLSDGFDSEGGVRLNEAIDRAHRAGIVIYALGVASLAADDSDAVNRETLQRLCAATGGRAFFPRLDRDFANAFALIDGDLRQQYVLSYAPSATSTSFRAIRIEIPKRPDLRARHRAGYYSGGDASPR